LHHVLRLGDGKERVGAHTVAKNEYSFHENYLRSFFSLYHAQWKKSSAAPFFLHRPQVFGLQGGAAFLGNLALLIAKNSDRSC
jgi:hypothetical protein